MEWKTGPWWFYSNIWNDSALNIFFSQIKLYPSFKAWKPESLLCLVRVMPICIAFTYKEKHADTFRCQEEFRNVGQLVSSFKCYDKTVPLIYCWYNLIKAYFFYERHDCCISFMLQAQQGECTPLSTQCKKQPSVYRNRIFHTGDTAAAKGSSYFMR